MDPTRLDVNLSILFTELPLLERPGAARAAGFDAAEFWWPWPVAVPSDTEIDSFVEAVTDAGITVVELNFFAGDMANGDRGVLSWPHRSAEFRDHVATALGVGERLGCRAFNALFGERRNGVDHVEQDHLAQENLIRAAEVARKIDAIVLVEPVSGSPGYPVLTTADALAVIDRARASSGFDNIELLLDIYHLAVNGDIIDAAIDYATGLIGHVQIADAPGRHEPGTGKLPIQRHLAHLDRVGYRGWIGLEYNPSGASVDSFGWVVPEDLEIQERSPANRG